MCRNRPGTEGRVQIPHIHSGFQVTHQQSVLNSKIQFNRTPVEKTIKSHAFAGNFADVTLADINRFLDGLKKLGPISENGIAFDVGSARV